MSRDRDKSGFVIDGLTRTGSTTLAALLNCHPDIKCLMEPFHPRRYGGQFHNMAIAQQTVESALALIWCRWTGIKHVWESTGWPFIRNTSLNDGVVLSASKVLFLQRRNLLRRWISSFISKQLGFWIGTRQEFYSRLEEVQIKDVDPNVVAEEMRRDQLAVTRRIDLLHEHRVETMYIFYEDLYSENVTREQQYAMLNDISEFLGFEAITEEFFSTKFGHLLDPEKYQWSSPDVYRRIPRIKDIEDSLGCDETGWIFP